jgi:hypothetical protein
VQSRSYHTLERKRNQILQRPSRKSMPRRTRTVVSISWLLRFPAVKSLTSDPRLRSKQI